MACDATLQIPLASAYAVPLGICLLTALALVALWFAPAATRVARLGKRLIVGLALATVLVVAGGLVYEARTAGVRVQGDTLVASALFVSAQVPLAAIDWPGAADASALRLPWRRNGTSTGGVQLGRFGSDDGREVFVLRASADSLRVPVRGDLDLVLGRQLYDEIRACLQAPAASVDQEGNRQ